ncbi:MAG: helix-turn-helix domain-containing protein [Chloroflexi bacterium]|nr:helix-turn-helix domain-containing protein [Chloroflexota bacterium]MCI0578776.1 helix-turn-helix domain-containing protein [Chloroflexota bacterium]MCI0648727.1 helix-turn-helix domain-containing protein [Chloroflexota bacterium]MCI0731655.1 helix-turn-helix domain-containing protein [Chloroflexota bacterium]
MDESFPQPDPEFLITNPETLKVLGDPLRLQIIKLLAEPATVKEVAAALELPPTKLYYHVNLLEEHGLIRVVQTNVVSGIIEKSYQVAALRYSVAESLLTAVETAEADLENVLAVVLDTTRKELIASVRAGLMRPGQEIAHHRGTISHAGLKLTKEQAADFSGRLEALVQEFEALGAANRNNPEAQPYGYTIVLYPVIRE